MPKPTTIKEEPHAGESPVVDVKRTIGELMFVGDELRVRLLVQALSRVQGSLEGAKKDASNPHYKSKYATLHASWKAARKLLHANGFAIVQLPIPAEGGGVMLRTTLYHEDGANLECDYPVTYAPCLAPQLGAALKYARRYTLETVVGITTEDDPEDDDGNAAPVPSPYRPATKAEQIVPRTPNPPSAAAISGARMTLKDQASAYIEKVSATTTWDQFMQVIADAGDLVERIRQADKTGNWIARINELVDAKRTALEPASDTQQEADEGPGDTVGDDKAT